MPTLIYMDHHATTPVDPRVVDAMLPYLGGRYGNASSPGHAFGWEAREAVERARSAVAAALGAREDEIVFTSGATESNNAAWHGILFGASDAGGCRGRPHAVTVATEHPSVLDPARALARRGFDVSVLPVDGRGRVDPEDVQRALTPRTVLVSVMSANNEVGTLHPIDAIASVARRRGVAFHCDAVQALGWIPVDVERAGIDLASVSAHKIYGPKGVGALFVRREIRDRLSPLLLGGGHEDGLRSGTSNVPGIVGFGVAAKIAVSRREREAARIAELRDRLEGRLREVGGAEVNGDPAHRLPHNLNVSFAGVDGESLLLALEGIALSTGSACASARGEPSHVLRAMGLGEERVRSSVRFGLGRSTTAGHVEEVATRIAEAVARLRRLSPT